MKNFWLGTAIILNTGRLRVNARFGHSRVTQPHRAAAGIILFVTRLFVIAVPRLKSLVHELMWEAFFHWGGLTPLPFCGLVAFLNWGGLTPLPFCGFVDGVNFVAVITFVALVVLVSAAIILHLGARIQGCRWKLSGVGFTCLWG